MSKKNDFLKIITSLIITASFLILLATPVLAASWSMEVSREMVSGKANGETYSLNEGTRKVTGSIWVTKWNKDLDISEIDVNVVLYKSNSIWIDSRIQGTTVTVNKNGNSKSFSMSKTNQKKGTYYLYFSKPHNNTTVKGSGSIN